MHPYAYAYICTQYIFIYKHIYMSMYSGNNALAIAIAAFPNESRGNPSRIPLGSKVWDPKYWV